MLNRHVNRSSRRSCIQDAESRTPSTRGIGGARNWRDGDTSSQQSFRERFILYGYREIIPTGYAKIGPMIDTALRCRLDQPPDRSGGAGGPGGRTNLIAHHIDLIFF